MVTTSLFFFFQAEDGIRDLTVTGVQTCALPISIECNSRAQEAYFEQTGEHGISLPDPVDRKSTRLNSSHSQISYAVFCLKKKNTKYFDLLSLNNVRPVCLIRKLDIEYLRRFRLD